MGFYSCPKNYAFGKNSNGTVKIPTQCKALSNADDMVYGNNIPNYSDSGATFYFYRGPTSFSTCTKPTTLQRTSTYFLNVNSSSCSLTFYK
uniref:Uncharacterized protein n=1 Tax=viral metagenome TaxID=1070528 RepID=A0A6C0D2D4_9ZZZZ